MFLLPIGIENKTKINNIKETRTGQAEPAPTPQNEMIEPHKKTKLMVHVWAAHINL